MLSLAVSFFVLYGLVQYFEKDNKGIDGFATFVAVLVPVIIVAMFMGVSVIAEWGVVASFVSPILFLTATFLILWRALEISASRSAAYAFSVFAVNVVLGVLFMPAS